VIVDAKYVHTNLVARDWRRLARFYQDVFGCEPVGPQRDLSGQEYERGTAVPGAHARGMHLRLPGQGPAGPTLEIFEYEAPSASVAAAVDQPGFGHIAFAVPSVVEAHRQVLAAGGSHVGSVVETRISPDTVVTWCYVRDPEGNIVELQSRTRGVAV
jgi:catechol 2,3-dioxygenase-like lactoylglutathione lyase family enzyme